LQAVERATLWRFSVNRLPMCSERCEEEGQRLSNTIIKWKRKYSKTRKVANKRMVNSICRDEEARLSALFERSTKFASLRLNKENLGSTGLTRAMLLRKIEQRNGTRYEGRKSVCGLPRS
jgi:hypothetical protein